MSGDDEAVGGVIGNDSHPGRRDHRKRVCQLVGAGISKQCDPPVHLLRIEQKRGPGELANLLGDSADIYVLANERPTTTCWPSVDVELARDRVAAVGHTPQDDKLAHLYAETR